MFDKIKDKAKELRNSAIDKADDVVSGMKSKKDSKEVDQLGKKLAMEDMKNDGTFDAIKQENKRIKNPFASGENVTNTPNEEEQTLADFGVETDKTIRKAGSSSSYVGSIEYVETEPPTQPQVQESKSDVVDKVKDFVSDVTSPSKSGDTGRQRKRKLIVRKVTRLLQWVIIILIILFLRSRYLSYTDRVVQKLTYKNFPYTYVIERNARDFNVTKMEDVDCKDGEKKCKTNNVASYNIEFEGYQMFIIRTYFDVTFRLKNGDKSITKSDLTNEYAERSIWAIMTKDNAFLSMDRFKNFQIVDYEQKSEYKDKGFYYDEDDSKMYITIALGKQEYDGYSIRVREAHKKNKDIVLYVEMEEPPAKNRWKNENAPIVKLELLEKPENIRVVNINNGEEYKYKGHLLGDDSKSNSSISDIDVNNKGAEIK